VDYKEAHALLCSGPCGASKGKNLLSQRLGEDIAAPKGSLGRPALVSE